MIRATLVEITVKEISFMLLSAAGMGFMPSSRWRTVFSSTTMASSTRNPTANTMPMRDRVSRLNPAGSMRAQVPSREMGRTMLGTTVSRMRPRKKKITITTMMRAMPTVTCTSWSDSRMGAAPLNMVSSVMVPGSSRRASSTAVVSRSATATVLAPLTRETRMTTHFS